MLKRLAIIVIIIIFIEPIYSIGQKVYVQVKEWSGNDQITNLLNNVDEKITDVKSIISDESPIEPALPSELAVAVSGNVEGVSLKSAPTSRVVTNTEELADLMYEYFSSFAPKFEIEYVGSTKNIEKIVKEAHENATKRDDYVWGHLREHGVRYEYSRSKATIFGEQSYLMTPEQAAITEQQVDQVLGSITNKNMTNLEKVKAVNDYIVSTTAYTEETKASPHSAYTVLMEQSGVCQGYALLAHQMLQKLGIETKYIVGYVGEIGHAWNLVKLDGQWYHLDTTWNDPVPDRPRAIRYQYFLVNDRTMAKDHSWIAKDYPTATSGKYSDYHAIDFPAQVDQQLFYSNASDDNKLYVLNMTTGKKQRLSRSRAQYIVYANGWLYFSNYSNGAYLSKIRPDGSGEQLLNKEETKDLYVKDNYLYFTTDELKKMALQ
ncbi:MAG: transglutaminase domain-containing protein [Lysinibacillus sp.]